MMRVESSDSDGTNNYVRLNSPPVTRQSEIREEHAAQATIGECDVRELLFTVTFVACVDKMSINLQDEDFCNFEFILYFLGVFVFWADSSQQTSLTGKHCTVCSVSPFLMTLINLLKV